jgi:Asp-tRNA(Asn)/Glu-tRNA(Gln) amidotransferase B subunit
MIVQEKGLAQVSDTGAIEKFCDEVIAANPGPVADYKSGKVAALNFLKGQVMKLSKGKANPNEKDKAIFRPGRAQPFYHRRRRRKKTCCRARR